VDELLKNLGEKLLGQQGNQPGILH